MRNPSIHLNFSDASSIPAVSGHATASSSASDDAIPTPTATVSSSASYAASSTPTATWLVY